MKNKNNELGKYLDLTNDYAFKLIFGSENNRHLLIEMIGSFIPDRKIAKLEFSDREMQGLTPENKAVRFDLHCTDENGNEFLVEVQKCPITNFYERVLYYASLLYASNLEVGDITYSGLKPVYVISFLCSPLGKPEFKELNDLVLWYQMCEKTHKCFAPNGINIIFACIYNAAKSVEECKTETEKWCQIIRDMKDYTCEPKDLGGGKWSALAEVSQVALFDKETIVDYKKAMADAGYNAALVKESFEDGLEKGLERGIAKGREQGISEGMIEGRKKGASETKLSIAKSLLEDGIALEVVSKHTGLSLVEVLQLR